MSIKNNITLLQRELESSNCRLIVVSKTQPIEKIKEAYAAGQRLFGENKAQELLAKVEKLPADIEWHFIGHLQTNKVKQIAPFVSLIHSVDSQKLLEEINKQGKKINRVIPCLLQVFIAKEETKFGFDEPELFSLLEGPDLATFEFIVIQGLMGMASLTDNEGQVRNEFQYLKGLFERIKVKNPKFVTLHELSMGMSSDFKIAVEEGSTLIRIGTAIFGERQSAVN